ncbi:MAG TPA: rhomboid family intramembrane serine protease, partial [Chloroflexota bacterium]
LHGGWVHLLGNMIFLWVFGRAVEDRFGHFWFLVMYLLGGAAAAIFQSWLSGPSDAGVMIGASGAIAAVLGAYLISYPRAWVRVLVPVFFFFWFFDVPALFMLAIWFLTQFFTGVFSISRVVAPDNVAVWAHVAGFVFGMGAAIVLPKGKDRGRGAMTLDRRADGPGPEGLVNSIASLAVLLLALRVLIVFLEVRPGVGPLGQVAALAYTVTSPFVWPVEQFVPWIRLAGRPLDLPALVAILFVLVVAQLIVRSISGRARGRLNNR